MAAGSSIFRQVHIPTCPLLSPVSEIYGVVPRVCVSEQWERALYRSDWGLGLFRESKNLIWIWKNKIQLRENEQIRKGSDTHISAASIQARKYSMMSKYYDGWVASSQPAPKSSCQLSGCKLENNKQLLSGLDAGAGQSPRLSLRSGSLLQLGTQPHFLTLNRLESSSLTSSLSAQIKWIISIFCRWVFLGATVGNGRTKEQESVFFF